MKTKEDLNRLIKAYFEKRIESRKLSLELRQLLNNIYYLKSNFGTSETEEFKLDGGEVILKKYISKYSSLLNKEFKNLTIDEKRKLYRATGLINIIFRLNYRKYEKLKDKNEKSELDKFVIERKLTQPFYMKVNFDENTLTDLKFLEEKLKEDYDLESSIDYHSSILTELKGKLSEDDEEENDEEQEDVLDEMIESESIEALERATFSDDDPYGYPDETSENREKGFFSKYDDHYRVATGDLVDDVEEQDEGPIPNTMSEIEKHEELKNLKNQKEKIEKKIKELLKK